MSKAAHNSCQARADIPTGLGMHQKSTFAMSRLRHKRGSRGRFSRTLASVLGPEDFLTEQRALFLGGQTVQLPSERWVCFGAEYEQQLDRKPVCLLDFRQEK